MTLKSNIKKHILDSSRNTTISSITAIFALVYHVAFLLVFLYYKVYPMFYFNIGSVVLFSIIVALFFIKKVKDNMIPYLSCYVEVVLHQIMADYYLGPQSSFHYFILLMGLVAFLTLNNRFYLAVVMGFVSSFLFIFIECASLFRSPAYELPFYSFVVIRSVNIFLAIAAMLFVVLIFVYLALRFESNLAEQVDKKTMEVKIQHTKVVRLQDHIINSLSSLVENRDSDTGEHIQRTSAYVDMIARRAFEEKLYQDELDEKIIYLLKRAAPMHDIGKIVVPDSILKKPGRLTEEEFKSMQLHTKEGGRIIEEIMGISDDKIYVKVAKDVAMFHHERWDGNGYPCGLKEKDIPISARIMAIADVFDALVSPRCYKEPIPHEKAFKIIEEESGTHFDPKLVEIFLSMKNEVKEVLKNCQ